MATLGKINQKPSILAMLFILIPLLFIYILNSSASAKAEKNPLMENKDIQASEKTVDKLIVYYFHGNFRCYSCRTIEQYTKEAVNKFFSEEIKSGLLEFKPVNIDEKENKHFVNDYHLYTKSVILSLRKNKKEISYTNLEKVWQYLRDENKFFNYIKEETEKVLKEAK